MRSSLHCHANEQIVGVVVVVVEVRCSVKVGSPWVWDEEWQDNATSIEILARDVVVLFRMLCKP